ncbi:MAG: addiction module protein [Actinomycetota bacterium]
MTAAEKAEIIRLPVEERLALAEEIWESIRSQPDQLDLTESQRRELDRRADAHNAQPESTEDLQTTFKRIRQLVPKAV